jgi:DNA-binding NarL/FixJ family response regulator
VQEMLSLGASGCLLADTDRVELARAIQVVMFGGQYLGPCLTQAEPRTLPQRGTGVAQIRI